MGKKISRLRPQAMARLQAATAQKQASLPSHGLISDWGQVACPAALLG